MDLNDARILVTLVALVTFIGIVIWAFSPRRKQTFDELARMVIEDKETDEEYRSAR